MSLQKYEDQAITGEDLSLFDLILTQTPGPLGGDFIEHFCGYSKSVLKPGHFLFVIASWIELHI